jgi:dTDP-4-dehydrorhamnose reductase
VPDPVLALFGPNGLLGSHLCTVLPRRYDVRLIPGDIRMGDEVFRLVDHLQPDVVVNCAAFTNMDEAERQPHKAMAVNGIGAASIAQAAENVGATLVQFSTDAVFDALEGQHVETTLPQTVGAYSLSKLAGELMVQRLCGKVLLIRTAHLFGKGGKNNASTMAERLRAGEVVHADPLRFVTPTWAKSVALRTLHLLDLGLLGTFHAVSPVLTTWFQFAQRMLEVIRTGAVEPAPVRGPAPRPMRSVIVETQTPANVPKSPPWHVELGMYLSEGGYA